MGKVVGIVRQSHGLGRDAMGLGCFSQDFALQAWYCEERTGLLVSGKDDSVNHQKDDRLRQGHVFLWPKLCPRIDLLYRLWRNG